MDMNLAPHLAQLRALVYLQTERVGEMAEALGHATGRIALLEAQVHTLTQRLQADDPANLPYFQRKTPVSDENTSENA